jgi:hypothetical protein
MIKITTPQGKVFIVPEEHNKTYYESLNASIKDEKQQYKIEAASDEERKSYSPEKRAHAAASGKLKEAEAALAKAEKEVAKLQKALDKKI